MTNVTATIIFIVVTNWLEVARLHIEPDGLRAPVELHLGAYATNVWATLEVNSNRYTILLDTIRENAATNTIRLIKRAEPTAYFHGWRYSLVPPSPPLPPGFVRPGLPEITPP